LRNEAKKTEHSGAKKGKGAYWGRKKVAKHESNRMRRIDDKTASEIAQEYDDIDPFLVHEALDRTNLILRQLEDALGEHPIIQQDGCARVLYEQSVENLSQLYQLIDRKSLDGEER
jgi:hypothetical protein